MQARHAFFVSMVAAPLLLSACESATGSSPLALPEGEPGFVTIDIGGSRTVFTKPREPEETWVIPEWLGTSTIAAGGLRITCNMDRGKGYVYYRAEDGKTYKIYLKCVNPAEDGGGGG